MITIKTRRYFVYLNDYSVNAVEYLDDFETLQEAKNYLMKQRYNSLCFIAYDYISATYRDKKYGRNFHREWWLDEKGKFCETVIAGFYNDDYESE